MDDFELDNLEDEAPSGTPLSDDELEVEETDDEEFEDDDEDSLEDESEVAEVTEPDDVVDL